MAAKKKNRKQKRGGREKADAEQESEEYEIDAIVDERDDGMLLVSWVGYDACDNTWEDESTLPRTKVKAYRKGLKKKQTNKSKGTDTRKGKSGC